MSAALSVAAAKWARAVRERQAATAALRRAKEASRDRSMFSQERATENACDDRASTARKEERRAAKALLKIIEKSAYPVHDLIDV